MLSETTLSTLNFFNEKNFDHLFASPKYHFFMDYKLKK